MIVLSKISSKSIVGLLLGFLITACCQVDETSDELNLLPIDSPQDIIITTSEPFLPSRSHVRQNTGGGEFYIRLSRQGKVTALNIQTDSMHFYSTDKDGPFAIDYPCSALLDEKGGVTVFGADRAVKIDESGSSISRFSFGNDQSEVPAPKGYFVLMDPLYPLSSNGEKVYVSLRKEGGDAFSFPFVYEGSAVGELDIRNGSVRALNIQQDHQNVFYGGLHKENIKYFNEKLYVTFEFSPNIYVYDLENDVVEMIQAPPAFGEHNLPFTGSSDPMDIIKHMNISMAYGPLHLEEGGDFIFQTLLVPSLTSPGKARSGAVRKFDKNLKLLKEGRLPKYSVPYNVFVKDGNLYYEYGRSSYGENQIYYRMLN